MHEIISYDLIWRSRSRECIATSITSGSCEAARAHLDRDMFLLLDMFQEIMRQKLVNFAAVCVPALENIT